MSRNAVFDPGNRQGDQNTALRILLVDSDLRIRMALKDALSEAGMIVRHAADADEAIDILTYELAFAIIISAVHIPGSMSGVGLANAVRKRWPTSTFVLTSDGKPPDSSCVPGGFLFLDRHVCAANLPAFVHRVLDR